MKMQESIDGRTLRDQVVQAGMRNPAQGESFEEEVRIAEGISRQCSEAINQIYAVLKRQGLLAAVIPSEELLKKTYDSLSKKEGQALHAAVLQLVGNRLKLTSDAEVRTAMTTMVCARAASRALAELLDHSIVRRIEFVERKFLQDQQGVLERGYPEVMSAD